VFDNGGGAGYGALIQGLKDAGGNALGHWPNKFRHFSRVLEIDPRTLEIVWEYKQPKPSEDLNDDGAIRGNEKFFFSNIMGAAQRLPNGNTFITEADTGRLFEVTIKGKVVWEYVPPWAGGPSLFTNGMYRAYRVPKSYVPKDAVCPTS
jgi:hypothetical protein